MRFRKIAAALVVAAPLLAFESTPAAAFGLCGWGWGYGSYGYAAPRTYGYYGYAPRSYGGYYYGRRWGWRRGGYRGWRGARVGWRGARVAGYRAGVRAARRR